MVPDALGPICGQFLAGWVRILALPLSCCANSAVPLPILVLFFLLCVDSLEKASV